MSQQTTSTLRTDESNVTDIELTRDGRIFVFGTSLEVLDVLNRLRTRNGEEIAARLSSHREDTLSSNTHIVGTLP